MIRALVPFTLALSCACAQADELTIIGEQLAQSPGQHCDEGGDHECASFRLLTYRVVQVLRGNAKVGQTVDVLWTEENKRSEVIDSKFAALHVERVEGEPEYGADDVGAMPVHRTRDGRFARCGCERRGFGDEEQELVKFCRRVSFEPKIVEDVTHASAYRRHVLQAKGFKQTDANTMTCTRGVYIDDIVRAFETPTEK